MQWQLKFLLYVILCRWSSSCACCAVAVDVESILKLDFHDVTVYFTSGTIVRCARASICSTGGAEIVMHMAMKME